MKQSERNEYATAYDEMKKNGTITEYDYESEYDELLNESYGMIRIGSLQFEPARIVRKLDPIAYRCGLNEYIDMIERE